MKLIAALFFLCLTQLAAAQISGEFGPAPEGLGTEPWYKRELFAARDQVLAGLGTSYCSAVEHSGVRLHLDLHTRGLFMVPFIQGVDKGVEVMIANTLKAGKMVKEVKDTFKMFGVGGTYYDQISWLQAFSRDNGRMIETRIVLAVSTNQKDGAIIVTDNVNGTVFVGATNACH